MPEQVVESGSIRCVDHAGRTIAKPRIEGEHYCDKDARIEALEKELKEYGPDYVDKLQQDIDEQNVLISKLKTGNKEARHA